VFSCCVLIHNVGESHPTGKVWNNSSKVEISSFARGHRRMLTTTRYSYEGLVITVGRCSEITSNRVHTITHAQSVDRINNRQHNSRSC